MLFPVISAVYVAVFVSPQETLVKQYYFSPKIKSEDSKVLARTTRHCVPSYDVRSNTSGGGTVTGWAELRNLSKVLFLTTQNPQ